MRLLATILLLVMVAAGLAYAGYAYHSQHPAWPALGPLGSSASRFPGGDFQTTALPAATLRAYDNTHHTVAITGGALAQPAEGRTTTLRLTIRNTGPALPNLVVGVQLGAWANPTLVSDDRPSATHEVETYDAYPIDKAWSLEPLPAGGSYTLELSLDAPPIAGADPVEVFCFANTKGNADDGYTPDQETLINRGGIATWPGVVPTPPTNNGK